jgi:integrase
MLPGALMKHVRRWHRLGIVTDWVVEWEGRPVQSIKKSFEAAVERAGLGRRVTPHVLRHTCATWLMQSGVDMWEAANFLGMTTAMLERVYGHHQPDHNAAVDAAFSSRKSSRLA